MTEEEIYEVVRKHLFSFKGRCECGVYIGRDPNVVASHLSGAIYEAMESK